MCTVCTYVRGQFHCYFNTHSSSTDIDLYNLNVVNASDKCISVLWDHPPDVTPGKLTYNVVLRDGDHIVNEITTKDTQVIVCDLCSRSVYTVSLSSNDTVVTTQAGDTSVRVRTNGQ